MANTVKGRKVALVMTVPALDNPMKPMMEVTAVDLMYAKSHRRCNRDPESLRQHDVAHLLEVAHGQHR